jgi:hypothetical protein
MKIYVATCSCGQLSARCEGQPIRVTVCHGHACQRRTGSAFSANARYDTSMVTIAGVAQVYTRIGDEKNRINHSFCPICGTTVHYSIDSIEGMIAIPVGGFADQDFPPPTVSVYGERQMPWVEITADPLTRDD